VYFYLFFTICIYNVNEYNNYMTSSGILIDLISNIYLEMIAVPIVYFLLITFFNALITIGGDPSMAMDCMIIVSIILAIPTDLFLVVVAYLKSK